MSTHPHGEQISAYLDGMLDNAQVRAVAAHLRSCPPCRDLYEDLRQTKRLLANSPAPAAPPSEFWTNTYRRLRTEADAAPARTDWAAALRRSWQGPQRRWAAGVAAMAVLGGFVTVPSLMTRPPAAPAGGAMVNPTSAAQDAVDVSALVRAHTSAAAAQPLADPDRQAMLAADVDDSPLGDLSDAEAAAHADAAP